MSASHATLTRDNQQRRGLFGRSAAARRHALNSVRSQVQGRMRCYKIEADE